MVYGAKIMKELDCWAMHCAQRARYKKKTMTDFAGSTSSKRIRWARLVLLTEPTAWVLQGSTGRMEIKVVTKGVSCRFSSKGDNAIYKIAPIILELRALNENLMRTNSGPRQLDGIGNFLYLPCRYAAADSALSPLIDA